MRPENTSSGCACCPYRQRTNFPGRPRQGPTNRRNSTAAGCTAGSRTRNSFGPTEVIQLTRWVLSCCSTTTFCCCCCYQNFVSKFAKFDRIFFRFCKFLKISRIFTDYLWFPAIPTKFRENIDEKSPILDDFSNILQKSQEITEILQIFTENLQFLNLKRFKGMLIL